MAFAAAALPFISAGAGIAGGLMQYAGGQNQAAAALQQGQATSDAASYQAKVAENNKIIADQNADYTIAAGERKAADVSMKGAENVAKVRNTMATSGVDVNSGSAVNVQQSAREVEKLDTETAMNNSQLQAYGYRTQATNFEAEAGLERMKASQAKTGAGYAAEGSELGADAGLLSSASSLGSKWATGGFGFGGGGSRSGTFDSQGNPI
jgi:hypothetical protein